MLTKQQDMENNRILPIRSGYNFRDLGGYLSSTGKHVKWHTLLRSGDFPKLEQEDISLLKSLNLKTVVDFRSEEEYNRLPDTVISGVSYYKFPLDSGNLVPQFIELTDNRNKLSIDEIYKRGIQLMITMYDELVFNFIDELRQFFKILSEPANKSVLYHCTAGKDRTGFATALILSALDVDRNTIIEDYLLTNKCLVGKYENLKQYGALVDFFQTVRVEYLESVFKSIDDKFGGMYSYLTNELQIDIELFQRLYLE